jgi:predicted ester cyclase
VDVFLSPNYRRHRSPTECPLTREQQKELLIGLRVAFPDVTIELEDIVAEGDKIAFRSTMRGTHQGEFLDIAPTGLEVIFSLLDIIRIEDGSFVEQWGGPDIYDLLQKLSGE